MNIFIYTYKVYLKNSYQKLNHFHLIKSTIEIDHFYKILENKK